MMGLALAAIWLVGLCAYTYRRGQGRGVDGPPWVLGVATLVGLPYLVRDLPTEVRFGAAALALVVTFKMHEFRAGRICDREMAQSFPRFLFWFLVPPDSRYPRSAAQGVANRREGLVRLGRAALKGAILALWLAIRPAMAPVVAVGFLETFLALWLIYLLTTGVADVITGTAMQTGIKVAEVFEWPPGSASPREFWSRRWNRYVHTFAFRNVFLPYGGRARPFVLGALVFFASGLLHEYLVVATLGHLPVHFGSMTAFFVVQGFGVIAQTALERARPRRRARRGPLRRTIAVGLHLVWLTATAPLFVRPLDELFANATWSLW